MSTPENRCYGYEELATLVQGIVDSPFDEAVYDRILRLKITITHTPNGKAVLRKERI